MWGMSGWLFSYFSILEFSLEELEFSVAFWTFLLNCVQLQNFIQHWISLTVGFADVLSP